MKIFNVRYGFATNSSSSHSLILLPGGYKLSDLAPEWPDDYYGREVFTCATPEQKRRYFAAQLGQAQDRSGGEDAIPAYAGITNEMITELTGVQPAAEYDRWSSAFGGIDHQSMWTFPLSWDSASLHPRWLEEFFDFMVNHEDVAVLGGDDNGMNHPEFKEETAWHNEWLNLGEDRPNIVARLDNDAGYWTLFDRIRGARYRLIFGSNQPPTRASIPELVDLKLTDHCPFGCAWCYQSSTSKGQHATFDSIETILKALASLQVFEVAFGGGEPTLHPNLDEIVQLTRDLHIVPNLTTRNLTWIREQTEESLARFGGVAYSIHCADDVTKLLESIPENVRKTKLSPLCSGKRGQVVAQLVMGTVSREEYREILRLTGVAGLTLTLLAYKIVGFGASQVPIPYEWWLEDYQAAESLDRPPLHVDTPLAAAFTTQLKAANIPHWLYDTKDGSFSFYIDAVTNKCAPSSYEADLSLSRPLSTGHAMVAESILYEFRQIR